jgi:hypothetical protein
MVPRAWRFQKKKEERLEKMNMMGGPGVAVGERRKAAGLTSWAGGSEPAQLDCYSLFFILILFLIFYFPVLFL